MNATKIIAISRHRHHAATGTGPALLSPVSVKTDGTDGTGGTALIRKGFFCAAMLFPDGTGGTNCDGSVSNPRFTVCIHTKRYQSIRLPYESIQPPRRLFRAGAGAGRSGAGAGLRLGRTGQPGFSAGRQRRAVDAFTPDVKVPKPARCRGCSAAFEGAPCHVTGQPRNRAARGAAGAFRAAHCHGIGQPRQRATRRCDRVQAGAINTTMCKAGNLSVMGFFHVLILKVRACPVSTLSGLGAPTRKDGGMALHMLIHPAPPYGLSSQTVVFCLAKELKP